MLWVLRRMRDRGPGHYNELATATARWRPRSSAGAAWRGEGAPARGEVGPEAAEVPREVAGGAAGGLQLPSAAGGGAQRRRC